MTSTFSIYMNLIRFSAASLVFYYHCSFPRFLHWLPWADIGHHAVIVFFVLSGYVIAHVCASKEIDFKSYAISRLSRLYSVVLPALVLTTIAFYIGREANPALYVDETSSGLGGNLLAMTMNGAFLNQIWYLKVPNLSNTPYWSLAYEFWYYVLFGLWFFLKGQARMLLIAGTCLFVGPKILLLLPAWLLGVLAYRYNTRSTFRERVSWILFLTPPILYVMFYFSDLRTMSRSLAVETLDLGWSKYFVVDYLLAILTACNLVGAYNLSGAFSYALGRVRRPIVILASYTFSLYLFHYPLLHFFAAVLDHDPENKLDGVILSTVTLTSVFLLGHFSEHKKDAAKHAIEGLLAWGHRIVAMPKLPNV